MVKGPDGVIHSFPDDVTDQEIQKALGVPKQNDPKQPRSRTWTDTAVDAIPLVAGAIGGLAAAPSGPGAIGAAALAGAGGEGVRQIINRARGVEAPETPMDAAKDMGVAAAMNAGAEVGGQALGAGMRKAAPWLMNKVVKPSYQLLQDYKTTAPKLAQTLLDNGINVTESGLSKLQGLMRATNQEIRDLVENSTAKVNKDEVLRRVDELAANTMKTSANPNKALAKATEVADQFVEHPYYKGESIPVAAAHDLKVGTYKEVGNAYRKPEKAQALKALARGLKEEVAAKVPGVADKNAEEAALMAAGEAVSKRIAVDANADPFGILWASHNPSMFIAGLIHKQPVVRSMLANGMWKSAGAATKVAPQVLRSAMYAIASGQHEEDEK